MFPCLQLCLGHKARLWRPIRSSTAEGNIDQSMNQVECIVARNKFLIAASDLNRALPFLEELGREAVVLLPNLLEPWQVISETAVIGQQT